MKSWKSSSLPLCGVAVRSKKLPGVLGKQLSEAEALRVPHLRRKERGRHLVRLIHDNEVPIDLLEPLLEFLATAEFVEPADAEIVFRETNCQCVTPEWRRWS